MKKVQYAVALRETGNASGKAKKDAYETALQLGFAPSYHASKIQGVRVLQQIISLPRFLGKKIIFFQYPAVSEQLMGMFEKVVSKKAYKIALIHDLSSIQGLVEYDSDKEAKYLNIFDCIIVHNERMKRYALDIGYNGKTVILELFDYLHDLSRQITDKPFSNSISFAGNLDKAEFLQKVGTINCNWLLYGSESDFDFSKIHNIAYKGVLPSDEIQYLMEGDYGLVWNGDSIDTCTGLSGEYLRYNNPHKLSCYIAAGKPVITWKQAAIADFIEKNHIGFTVESLEEISTIDLESGYTEMKSNVMELKRKIANGEFLQRAMMKAMESGEIVE